MEENKVVADNSNTAEESALQSEDSANEESNATETVEEMKVRLAKAEELAQNYKVRAEKAERKAKETPKNASEATKNTELNSRDLYALVEAKVSQDDIDEVVEYAKLKKISVSEALKTSVVKAILSDNEEKRKTAQVTNTGASRRSPQKPSESEILDRASKGNLPEDVEALAIARMNAKKKK